LAIHDDVFATGLRVIEEMYRIGIPQHMNVVRLEMKETKLDLTIFRRPARSVNQSRKPMTIGFGEVYAAKPMKTPLPAITTTSPVLGIQVYLSLQPITASICRPRTDYAGGKFGL
jgi:hypothetical protein